jgi:hypothetical protein
MTPIDRRVFRLAALPLAALIAVAACGGSSTPAPSAAGSAAAVTQAPASQAPESQAAATEAPATEAPASEDTGGVTIPSGLFNQAPDLEAVLPSQACGGPVVKQSYAGGAGDAAASANPMLGAFGALGAGGDVAIAVATSTTPDTCPVSYFAYRIKGLNSTMFQGVLAAMAAGGGQVSLGGKNVTKIPNGDTSTYIYVKDDTMFGVESGTDDQAAQALSALP